jgi:hypothetical protein
MLATEDTKDCPSCKGRFPLTAFYKNVAAGDGLSWYCKKCQDSARNASVLKRFGSHRGRALWEKYRITEADYDHMLEAQDGACMFCRRTPEELGIDFLCVDHDHATKAVRWLLCHGCNTGIGSFRENANVLRTAADLIENYQKEATKNVRSSIIPDVADLPPHLGPDWPSAGSDVVEEPSRSRSVVVMRYRDYRPQPPQGPPRPYTVAEYNNDRLIRLPTVRPVNCASA